MFVVLFLSIRNFLRKIIIYIIIFSLLWYINRKIVLLFLSGNKMYWNNFRKKLIGVFEIIVYIIINIVDMKV